MKQNDEINWSYQLFNSMQFVIWLEANFRTKNGWDIDFFWHTCIISSYDILSFICDFHSTILYHLQKIFKALSVFWNVVQAFDLHFISFEVPVFSSRPHLISDLILLNVNLSMALPKQSLHQIYIWCMQCHPVAD